MEFFEDDLDHDAPPGREVAKKEKTNKKRKKTKLPYSITIGGEPAAPHKNWYTFFILASACKKQAL